jgi:hypothetical protein
MYTHTYIHKVTCLQITMKIIPRCVGYLLVGQPMVNFLTVQPLEIQHYQKWIEYYASTILTIHFECCRAFYTHHPPLGGGFGKSFIPRMLLVPDCRPELWLPLVLLLPLRCCVDVTRWNTVYAIQTIRKIIADQNHTHRRGIWILSRRHVY